jgi:hypothetical protein
MSTLADLIALSRVRLDDTVEPYRWDDDTITEHANDAVRQAVIRKRLILDRTTAEVCSYAVAADASAVTLHSTVLAIRTARWSGSTEPLALTTLKRMDSAQPDWPSEDAGIPTHLILDADTGKVTLWPAAAEAGTLALAVWRTPLEDELLEGDEDEPVIDEAFHRDLLDWIEHLAFLTPEGEAGDLQRSDRAETRFTAKFGAMPSAHSMKLWALGRGRGQTAQFT